MGNNIYVNFNNDLEDSTCLKEAFLCFQGKYQKF